MPSSESSSSSSSESSAPSSPEVPKKASQSKSSPPKVPKKKSKSTAEKHKESDSSDSSEKVSKSRSSSPEASKKIQKSPEESNTSEPLTKAYKSPSSSPEAPKKVIKPPKEVPKDSHTFEPPKEVSKSPSSSPEAPKKVVKPPKEVPKESDISVPPKKGSKSPPGSPEASKTVLKTYKKVPQKLQTSWPPKQPSKSPSSSPEAPKKIVKTPEEGAKEAHTGAPRQASQPPPSSQRPKMVLRDKPPSCQEESGKASTAPEGSTEVRPSPKDPVIALKDRPRGSFKSSLQVLLKRQEEELEKTIEYKEKLEKGELDDEEDDAEEEDAGRQGRRGSEANTTEDKRRKKSEDGGRKEAKEQQKDKPKKQKEDEDVKTKTKNEEGKAKSKEKTKPKADEDITKTKKREEDKEKKTKEDQDATDLKGKRREEDKNKNAEDKAYVTIIKIEGKEQQEPKQTQRKGQADEDKTEEKEDKEEMKKPPKEEKVEAPPKREKKVSVREKTPTTDQPTKEDNQRKETKTKKQEEETRKEEKQKKEEEEVKKAKRKEEMTKEKQRREEEEKKKPKKKEEVREEAPRKEESQTEAKRSVQQKKSKEEKTVGHLYMKRKRTFNPWKEYYFVLDDQLLTYYRSQQQYEHLSGMKGSLDLSLVEVVQPGRPGLLKTHHPICLTRRNLPSIHLAAATKQEQQRWVDVLRSAVRPHRLSACNSDQTLNTASAAAAATAADQASESKSNTLPARVKSIRRHSSSASDEEEDEEKEEKKEEEPELIQPKKVLRVPIGLPMAGVNLGQVKLKRAETKKEDAAETAAAPAAAHSTAQDIAREKSPPGELFGVVLKKTKKQEEEEEEEKKAPKDTTATTATTASVRRPSKQPVIPLNSGKLLVVPEVKSSKTSPDTQKRQTPERKKSPSPSLPISKSVQALTKSAEEVRATQADVASHEPSSSASMTPLTPAVAGEGEVVAGKLCHAQTTEVQYINVEMMEEAEEVVEVLPAEREAKTDDDNKDEVQETGPDAVEVRGEQRHKGGESLATEARPPRPLMGTENNEAAVCAGLQGGSAMQEREENLDKECREASDKEGEAAAEDHQLEDESEGTPTPPPDTPSAPQPLTPPASPASSKASADSDKSSSPPSPVSPPCKSPSTPSSPSSLAALSMQAVKSSPSLPQSPPVSPGTHSEESQVTVEAVKGTLQQEDKMEGKVQEGSWETRRPRADSNESTGTSSSECGEKKPGKLQSLKRKLTGGSRNKEKREEPASPKEPKKRRGSNAFSELMARKKNGGKKPSEEPQPEVSQDKAPSEPPAASQPAITVGPSHMTTASSEPPSLEASLPPGRALVGMNLEEADSTPPQKTEDSLPAPADRSLGDQSRVEDVSAPSMAPPPSDGACYDTHSLSLVSCDDQPPSIPEKTRIRAHSPNHDVPRSNRPVTNIDEMVMGVEDEDEASQTVDGYITEEQIEALLNAKENREKRRQSKKGAHHLLSPQDAAKGATLPTAMPPPSSEELGPSRPFFNSFSSVESDESLPVATFLGIHRSSSSSGSGDSLSTETEPLMETTQRRAPRPTDAITVKHRVSLTSPEFTVQEEEGLSSPETVKARPPCQGGDNDKREQKNGDDPQAKVKKGAEDEGAADADSEAEQEDFFPVVGRDVQLRQPAAQHGEALSLPKAELRTSGIIGLKEYLKAQEQEDLEEVKSGISRLGHSAAVEKLKQEASREQ